MNEHELDVRIERIHGVCEVLERSRSEFIASVEVAVSARCEDSVKIEKIREALAKYYQVRKDFDAL
jgi:hypothetical protein